MSPATALLLAALVAVVAGVAGGTVTGWFVLRATRAGLAESVRRAELAAVDGGRAAREALVRAAAMEFVRAAGRVPTMVRDLGLKVTRDDRRRGYQWIDELRALGTGPGLLTPPELQQRWHTLVDLLEQVARAWPVVDPVEYGGDESIEEQLAHGGWLPEVYAKAQHDVVRYAEHVAAAAVAVIRDQPLPEAIGVPTLP